MNKSVISGASALITGALTTAAALGFGVDTTAAALIGANSPILQHLILQSLESLLGKHHSKSECARLGIAYDEVCKTIKKHLDAGDSIKMEGFLNDASSSFSNASEIAEAAFKYTMDDSETIKAQAYGRFIGNIPFCDIDKDVLFSLSKLIRELTYRELCTMCTFYGKDPVNFTKLEYSIRNVGEESIEQAAFFARILHLKSLGVLMSSAMFISNSAIGQVFLSKTGRLLYQMLELQNHDEDSVSKELALFQEYALK